VKRVACVGIAVLDLVFRVDALPRAPGKHRAQARREVGGGVAATAAAAIERLGGRARFLGAVGDDATGARIVEDLARRGVDVEGVRRVAGRESPLSLVLVDASGERLIVNHASADLFERAAPLTPGEIGDVDAVLADMRWPGGAIPALEEARRRGRTALLDCDHDPSGRTALLASASHVVFSLPTLARFTGAENASDALRRARAHTDAWLAATDGANGVYWLEDGRLRHLPAFRVEAVDTLGAGDVFHGALALALAEARPLEEALRWASAAAALKCARFGGRDGIPERSEVDALAARSAA